MSGGTRRKDADLRVRWRMAKRPHPARSRDAGVTLVEVLVVLAVIGVASGATMMSVRAADRDSRAEAEAVRLARHLALGMDEALIGGVPLALVWDAEGYRFDAWSSEDSVWRPATVPLLGTRHDLRAPMTLSAEDGDGAAVLLQPGGLGDGRTFEVSRGGGTDPPVWQVEFDGFGAVARPAEAGRGS